ncbi:fibrinogen like 1B [Callorhinchus milii]|uniref:Fibrinogen like 1B n=1 Tax=Callorhinchus milii TaxID=7868 RepID=A0A4W3KEK2_CALMI|nr:fibrinogen like 1B [Callorhinchus milii]|eukprot:gi/632948106/ref/XP_007889409.1/ PREDICTED: fibrinogen-like protein 1 [Callorhinchus milii]
MKLLIFLLFLDQSLASHRLDSEICMNEVYKLQRQLKHLQNQFLLGAWRLYDIKERHINWVKEKSEIGKKEDGAGLHPTAENLLVRDCSEVYNSGETTSGYYRIQPKAIVEPFLTYCDMSEGGGWTVIQRRSNGKVYFNRGWDDYKSGFGLFQGKKDEYWLGNDNIYHILANGKYLLKIDLVDWNGEKRYATYENVRVSNEKDGYRLEFGSYSGTAGDALSGGSEPQLVWSGGHNGMQFTTSDQDHDRFFQGNCAKENDSGWWFNRCHTVNLNGKYYRHGNYTGNTDKGIIWHTWTGWWYSLKFTAMKVRPQYFFPGVGSGDYENSVW